MNKKAFWICLALILAVLIAVYAWAGSHERLLVGTGPSGAAPSGEATSGQNQPVVTGSSSQSAGQTSVNVFVIDLDAGTAGQTIGCGDGLAGVHESIPPTKAVLSAALSKLLSIKDREVKVGNKTYYNALYQSDLKLDSAAISNGVATVKISGTTKLGGECDDPRVIAQIRATVMQFPTITSAQIFINNKSLEEYFSLK